MTRDDIKDLFNSEVTKFRNRFNELDGNIAIQILSSAIAKLQDAGIDAECNMIATTGKQIFNMKQAGGIFYCGGQIRMGSIKKAVGLHTSNNKNDQKILISKFDIKFDQNAETIKSHEFPVSDKNCEASLIKYLLNDYARQIVMIENDLHGTLQGNRFHSRPKKVDSIPR